jgi:hypothetical protein
MSSSSCCATRWPSWRRRLRATAARPRWCWAASAWCSCPTRASPRRCSSTRPATLSRRGAPLHYALSPSAQRVARLPESEPGRLPRCAGRLPAQPVTTLCRCRRPGRVCLCSRVRGCSRAGAGRQARQAAGAQQGARARPGRALGSLWVVAKYCCDSVKHGTEETGDDGLRLASMTTVHRLVSPSLKRRPRARRRAPPSSPAAAWRARGCWSATAPPGGASASSPTPPSGARPSTATPRCAPRPADPRY